MFALFPLPPTDHELQLRRLREEFGEGSAEMEAHRRRGRPARTSRTAGLRDAVALALIRAGERLRVPAPLTTPRPDAPALDGTRLR